MTWTAGAGVRRPAATGRDLSGLPEMLIEGGTRRRVTAAELWRQRDLLLLLASRDVKVRYRQTILGGTWVVLQPLLVSGVFTFVFGRVAKLPSDGVPYFVFAYAGLLGWTTFASLVQRLSGSLLANTALVSKVYFPRLLLPLSTVVSTAVDFLASLVLMVVLLFVGGVGLSWRVLTLPLWLGLVVLLAVGVGLAAAGLVVRYRDIAYITPLAVQLLLYASPVAYAVSAVPARLRGFVLANPLTGVLDGFRWALLPHSPLHLSYVAVSVGATLAVVGLGLVVFTKAERTFADVI